MAFWTLVSKRQLYYELTFIMLIVNKCIFYQKYKEVKR